MSSSLLPTSPWAQRIEQTHGLYCELTGQKLVLRCDRQVAWLRLMRLGFTQEDIRRVILNLQREIRATRRNVGALKLTNLLQPERFEEDLGISRVRLRPPEPPQAKPRCLLEPTLPPEQRERGRQRALENLRKIRESLK